MAKLSEPNRLQTATLAVLLFSIIGNQLPLHDNPVYRVAMVVAAIGLLVILIHHEFRKKGSK